MIYIRNLLKRMNSSQKYRDVLVIYSFLILYNVGAWVTLLYVGKQYPFMISLGVLAYTFGLRHAVDADHIAAIDNTTRKLLHDNKRPVGVGMYFSFGHSTVVFLLTGGIILAVRTLESTLPRLEQIGTLLGTAVSASFLYLIAGLNFSILRGIFVVFRRVRSETIAVNSRLETELEELLSQRGFMNRLFQRIFRVIQHSWQMYFVGFLFGLGFETATEVALLGISSSATSHGMPAVYVLLLPVLFAAGMSFVDTSDGILMLYAYNWAFRYPVRKIYYNLTVTTISILIAFVVGTIEWLQIIGSRLSAKGAIWTWINNLDFGTIGYIVIGILIFSWMIAAILYRIKGYEKTFGKGMGIG